MILTKEVKIRNTPSNRKLYKIIDFSGEFLTININDLKKGSHINIDVRCDNCGIEKCLSYKTYLKQFKKHNIYVCGSCKSVNIKKSFLDKYGVENVFQNENIKEKSKNTIKEKYGVDYITQSVEIKNKIINNNLKKYGVEYYNNNDKTKITNLKKYGNVCSLHDKEIEAKVKELWIKKYGTNYPMQNILVFNKMVKNSRKIYFYKNTNITYQSSYEKDFLDNYFEKIEIKNGLIIKYKINDKEKVYFSDFYLPKYNLIIEIKSSRTFEMETLINLTKQEKCIKDGYNFLFIIDKNYKNFEILLDQPIYFFNALN